MTNIVEVKAKKQKGDQNQVDENSASRIPEQRAAPKPVIRQPTREIIGLKRKSSKEKSRESHKSKEFEMKFVKNYLGLSPLMS